MNIDHAHENVHPGNTDELSSVSSQDETSNPEELRPVRKRRVPYRHQRISEPYLTVHYYASDESNSADGSVTWPRVKHWKTPQGWRNEMEYLTDEQQRRYWDEHDELLRLMQPIEQWKKERSDRWKAELKPAYDKRKRQREKKREKLRRYRRNKRERERNERRQREQQEQSLAVEGRLI